MSPTSYQAAPPRTTTISDAGASVKPLQLARFSDSASEQLPLVVRRVLEGRNSRGIRMHVNHASTRLIRTPHHAVILRHPILCSRYRISRDRTQVAGLHEILERLWCRLFIESIIFNRGTNRLEIMPQYGFVCLQH